MIKYFMPLLLIGLISCLSEEVNKKKLNASINQTPVDSIFCNVQNPNHDRILLCENNFFIRIYEEAYDDSCLMEKCGKYKYKKDTICFVAADSTDGANCIYQYTVNDYYKTKNIQIGPLDSVNHIGTEEVIYKKIFGKEPSIHMIMGISDNFLAYRKNDTIELLYDNKKFVLLKNK